jgi:fructose-1,6-bisphosphatase/inositol monophosphatase family enzyme
MPLDTNLKSATNGSRRTSVTAAEAHAIRLALARSVSAAGERLLTHSKSAGEFGSLDGSHVSSRNDLEGTALLVRYVPEYLSRAGLQFAISFESEELPLKPANGDGQRQLRLVIDPVDGSKAVDNYTYANDLPLPRPPSAISVAAVCPVSHQLVATAVYCFDLGEVYSSCLLNPGSGKPAYMTFHGDSLLSPLGDIPGITAKRRILVGNYNSRALVQLADLELAMMDHGLNSTYGGLTGSSATDIINVVRGSFAACIDVRALCAAGGSVPYWYDIAGAIGVAGGRGLNVVVTTAGGATLEGADHAIFTPVSFIVARPEVFEIVRGLVKEQFSLTEEIAA